MIAAYKIASKSIKNFREGQIGSFQSKNNTDQKNIQNQLQTEDSHGIFFFPAALP